MDEKRNQNIDIDTRETFYVTRLVEQTAPQPKMPDPYEELFKKPTE